MDSSDANVLTMTPFFCIATGEVQRRPTDLVESVGVVGGFSALRQQDHVVSSCWSIAVTRRQDLVFDTPERRRHVADAAVRLETILVDSPYDLTPCGVSGGEYTVHRSR